MAVRIRLVPIVAVLASIGSACSSQASSGGTQGDVARSALTGSGSAYNPDIDPADFVDEIDNPFFPLKPGTVWRLRGEVEDKIELETIKVTDGTKEILGVTTTVVKDVIRVEGEIVELTYDWYAQDLDGNVWYFGEDTAEYEDGKVSSREGSWEAGVDGALRGIIMNADPQVADSYRQEYYEGEAEDMYWVVSVSGSKTVRFGKFDDVVRTLEWNPLEPKVVGEKFYAPEVGLIAEQALSGPREVFELLDMTRP